MNHLIVYCSPNGSTRHVAGVIAARLVELNSPADSFDLGQPSERQELQRACARMPSPSCLWIGSPVYVDHMVPPVEHVLQRLPWGGGSYAVPFVTWGGVNSGVALAEMGALLVQQGYALLGAAKVLAVHSSLWRSEQPLGAGHPDAQDDAAVQHLVDAVQEKLCASAVQRLPLEALDYQPEAIKIEAGKRSIALAKQAYGPLAAAAESCSQCAECVEKCPVQAISLDPYPKFGEACFMCLKCVRECPQDAIPLDMAASEQRIRGLAVAIKETPPTRIFV
jgi:ferredoxin